MCYSCMNRLNINGKFRSIYLEFCASAVSEHKASLKLSSRSAFGAFCIYDCRILQQGRRIYDCEAGNVLFADFQNLSDMLNSSTSATYW
jgi:hypothetical protein